MDENTHSSDISNNKTDRQNDDTGVFLLQNLKVEFYMSLALI